MNKNTKIILSVLAVGLTATATFFIIKKIRRKKLEAKLVGGVLDQTRINEIQSTPLSASNPPTTTEIQAIVSSQPVDFAIKTQEDGNAFRKWVNDNHNDYARQIDLDPTGSHTNSYFEKAWKKYGAEYISSTQTLIGVVSQKVNEFVAQNPSAGVVANVVSQTFSTPINVVDSLINTAIGRGGVKNNTGVFSAKNSADNLYSSMKGWGTNEKLFFDTLTPLTRSQRIDVRNYYDKNGVGKKLGTLELSVRGEFGGAELTRAIDLIEL
tara:strand:+ start:809 stop:1609 length:801 start_codon:yes stop_codon:yes gene_type:complete